MKIEKSPIKITGQLLSQDIFKNLKEGSKLSVKISERLGQRHAILDFGGIKVKAEFLQGVPDSGKLYLILHRKVKGTLFFKSTTPNNKEIFEELFKFTVLNYKDLNKSKVHELRLYLKENINSIYALNSALLRFNEYTYNKNMRKIADIFNLLLSKGYKYENLILISALIYAKNPPLQQLYYIFSQIMPESYKEIFNLITKSIKKEKINKIISNFLNLIDSTFAEEEKIEIIRNILDFIIFDPTNNMRDGGMIFFDKDKFKLCKYIINANNILLSLNLTYLGGIDILIKDYKSYYSIAFLCEKDESLEALKHEVDTLESSLNNYNKKKVHIVLYNSAIALEKIIEIISSIDLYYLVDVKA